MKKGKIILVVCLAIIVIVGALGVIYTEGLKATGSSEETCSVVVNQGTTYNQLLDDLEQQGLIKNKMVAKVYLKLNKVNSLKANSYRLNKSLGTKEIIRIVSEGDFDYLEKSKLLVQEGLTIPEVASRVAELTGLSKEEVLTKWQDATYLDSLISKYWFLDETIKKPKIKYALEGYLFPETYLLTNNQPTVEECTEAMLNMTDQVLTPYKDAIEKRDWSVHEFLSFASVVEREGQKEIDYPKIAGVFMNRLKKNMKIQSDITVLYALGRTGVDVSYQDLQVESKYNTYKYAGLPIGPISNVSRTVIEACINYDKNDYIYFYATPDGEVLYAKTLSEHEKNAKDHPWN